MGPCIHSLGRRFGVTRRIATFLSSLAFAVALTLPVLAQEELAGRPLSAARYERYISDAAQRYGIPPEWIVHVLRAESAGEVHAVSSAGAMGLMQIMPGTWNELRERHGLGHDPYGVRDNILAGAAYLREMHDRFGTVTGMLAAYNAGPDRYEAYLAGVSALPAETRAYVAILAPLLGGDGVVEPAVVTASEASVWTNAPIFVVRSENLIAASSSSPATQTGGDADASVVQLDVPVEGSPAAVIAADLSAITPRSDGLFVARPAVVDAP